MNPSMVSRASDHPRVGGEHAPTSGFKRTSTGSSPRGRGTPFDVLHCRQPIRIIPAWAGNTQEANAAKVIHTDHPRVGGEHELTSFREHAARGSSPRGRGTRPLRRPCTYHRRIIPAWAGNTVDSKERSTARADHPRVGGEHFSAPAQRIEADGSSPRGRGTPQNRARVPARDRIIPAWAGNTEN